MQKPSRKFLKAQQARADELNAIIHSRNLYLNGKRVIDARVDKWGSLVVADLHSNANWTVLQSTLLTDGNGTEVTI